MKSRLVHQVGSQFESPGMLNDNRLVSFCVGFCWKANSFLVSNDEVATLVSRSAIGCMWISVKVRDFHF